MNILEQIVEQLRGAWRFRWVAVITAWIVCVLGWVVVALWPNTYEATAKVYVDTNTGLAPLLQGLAVEQDVDAQLQMVRQVMLGKPALEKVARATDLHLEAQTPEEMDELVTKLGDAITITNVLDLGKRPNNRRNQSSDSLYQITYDNSSRKMAVAVVRQLLNTFVEDTLGGKRSGNESAQKFQQAQIDQYARRLNDQELQLADFKKNNMGLVPGQSGDYFSKLEAESEKVRQARGDLALAMSRSEELRRQLHGETLGSAGDGSSLPTGTPMTDTEQRLADARKRLDDLLLKYTDKHPDVIATRQTIKELEQRQKDELAALKAGNGPTPAALAANPVYQSIQMALNENEVKVAELRRQVVEGEATITQLSKLASTAPEVEARYRQLTRDYEVTKTQYDALLGRLETARLSDQAQQTGIVRFEVVDPPASAFDPVSPNRPLLIFLVLLGGLGAGVALAYLMHLQRPVFSNARSLSDLTGLPVLGAVSATWIGDQAAAKRRDALRYGGAVAGLLVIFGIILTVQLLDLGLLNGIVG